MAAPGEKQAAKSLQDEEEAVTQVYATLGVALVVVVIGVPLWWKTTEVYRASLPYADIGELKGTQVIYKVGVEFVLPVQTQPQDLLDWREQVDQHLDTGTVYSPISPHYDIKVRTTNKEERTVINQQGSMEDLEASLTQLKPPGVGSCTLYLLWTTVYLEASLTQLKPPDVGSCTLYLLWTTVYLEASLTQLKPPDVGSCTLYLLPKDSSLEAQAYIGRHRTAFVKSSGDVSRDVRISAHLVRSYFVNDERLKIAFTSATGAQHDKENIAKEQMRAFKTNMGYEVTFSLLNPDPSVLDVQWDVEAGTASYLNPFLDRLADVAEFKVFSQVLYYVDLTVRPARDERTASYCLTPDQLPHTINPVEAKLGSHVSTYPSVHFLVYVPERGHSPLYIHNEDGMESETNAFFSPRWGGMKIVNVASPPKNASLPHTVTLDLLPVMETFLSHLRLLLGMAQLPPDPWIVVEPADNTAITDWEYDHLLRVRTVENLATATATLASLSQLLGEIGNIVINDDIAWQVYLAVDAIRKAQLLLATGELTAAFQASKEAILSSEKAFFDPSLLELLYFPEDQKFAIYIPLFLPMSVPVLMSLFQAFRWYKKRQQQEGKTNQEKEKEGIKEAQKEETEEDDDSEAEEKKSPKGKKQSRKER
ncbi:GPI transamidase component PIG-S-like [Branchiostoma floridae]|uniref:GPI transamidase component PIG-S-like n=1 Tax=Branchiostoma floridae TaxID=7739 RepID=A0A9J7N211_BRAFL|nr:GPI transamidase component PIG-S-like [Branchiostoma floridae]